MKNSLKVHYKKVTCLPRLPLDGTIDITNRCNNDCHHCWLEGGHFSEQSPQELSAEEIKNIVREARVLGCRIWSITGGEPMIRPDFEELFDFITSNSVYYTLNTNGTFITPRIARLMRRRGNKIVALYGASAQVHDSITKNPGSFELALRGMRYLKEAKAEFLVQAVPMKSNFHEFQKMVKIAAKFNSVFKTGAAWLRLSGHRNSEKNKEIRRQRLSPQELLKVNPFNLLSYDDGSECLGQDRKYLFSYCIASNNRFHIDPYGRMSFCQYIRHPDFRYDLRQGSFTDGWERFIPSLSKKIKITEDYMKKCGSCSKRIFCGFCPAYSYIEFGSFEKPIPYLCGIGAAQEKEMNRLAKMHRRYFAIADLTIQMDSSIPISDKWFSPKTKEFLTAQPGKDLISVKYEFGLPQIQVSKSGQPFARNGAWTIYRDKNSWVCLNYLIKKTRTRNRIVVTADQKWMKMRVFQNRIPKNDHTSVFFPTAGILSHSMAFYNGCIFHACGAASGGRGYLFLGCSGSGKSTLAYYLRKRFEILNDDTVILRRKKDGGFKIYSWLKMHEFRWLVNTCAELRGIFFVHQANHNAIIPIYDKKIIIKMLLQNIFGLYNVEEWWNEILKLVDELVESVPCYELYFKLGEEIANEVCELEGRR